MLFQKKEKKEEKMEVLQKKNILVNCVAEDKDTIVRKVGQLLVDSGYVKPEYIEGMLERENTFATNMGNGMAIPHGVEAVKGAILQSGVAIMVFPEGTLWNDEVVKIVIGIAGKGDEHLTILANVAEKLCEPSEVEKIATADADTIYEFINTKED